MILDRAALLAPGAVVVPEEVVPLLGLGGDVLVRAMTASLRDEYERLIYADGQGDVTKGANYRAKLLVCCLFQEDGTRMFTAADVDAVGRIRVDLIQPAYEAAIRLNRHTPEEVERLGKSSASAPVADSRSNSPIVSDSLVSI